MKIKSGEGFAFTRCYKGILSLNFSKLRILPRPTLPPPAEQTCSQPCPWGPLASPLSARTYLPGRVEDRGKASAFAELIAGDFGCAQGAVKQRLPGPLRAVPRPQGRPEQARVLHALVLALAPGHHSSQRPVPEI